jgi:hypothetical protein
MHLNQVGAITMEIGSLINAMHLIAANVQVQVLYVSQMAHVNLEAWAVFVVGIWNFLVVCHQIHMLSVE